jgi:hypothetical protein
VASQSDMHSYGSQHSRSGKRYCTQQKIYTGFRDSFILQIALVPYHVLERFVNNRYQHDVDRYLCRKLQMGRFLQAADIEVLRGPPQRSLSKAMALVDDRNNASVTRLQQAGNCRPFQGPLNAQELFAELSHDVSY